MHETCRISKNQVCGPYFHVTMSSSSLEDGSGKLDGRVAIVTGSSSGMGRAIALALAEAGASIVCADLRPEASPKGFEADKHIPTHEVISTNGRPAIFQKCDLGKTDEIVRLVQVAVEVSFKSMTQLLPI